MRYRIGRFLHGHDGIPACPHFGGSAGIQTRADHRNAQYLPILLGGLRLLMHSSGDNAKNAKSAIVHIEGDPDHPVNRGTLCPKGAALLDFVNSPSRLKYPEVREPGSNAWKRISWEEAIDRVAHLMKADRDANFIAKNSEGVTVNRWLSTGFLAASASSNESGYLTHKVVRSLGMLAFDNQARV